MKKGFIAVTIVCLAFVTWINNALPVGPFMLPFGWQPPISGFYYYHQGWPFTYEQWIDADKNANNFALVMDIVMYVGVIVVVFFVARKIIRSMRSRKRGVVSHV